MAGSMVEAFPVPARVPTGFCPRCDAPFLPDPPGPRACARCRLRFEAYPALPRQAGADGPFTPLGVGATNSGASASASAAEAGYQPCAKHAANVATGTCERCGDFQCGLCAVLVEGRGYCAPCFELLLSRGAFAASRQSFTTPGHALQLGVLSLVGFACFPANVIAAIAALCYGITALRQLARQPDLPGRWKAVAAVLLGCVNLLLSAGLFLARMAPWSW
jgi:hypothetical protein